MKRKVGFRDAERLRSLRLDWISSAARACEPTRKGRWPPICWEAWIIWRKATPAWNRLSTRICADSQAWPGWSRTWFAAGVDSRVDFEPIPGKDITLTIDERVQYVAERELAKAVQASHSQTGSVVAMNPVTGEILAHGQLPLL